MRSGLGFAFGVLLAATARADPPAAGGRPSAPAVAGSPRESPGDAPPSVPTAPAGTAGTVPYGYPPAPQYGWPAPVAEFLDARTLYFDATDSDAVLQVHQRLDDGRLVWRFVCSAPCITTASLRGEYRIGGPGISNSRTFLVPPRPCGILLVTSNRTRLDFTPDPVASAPRLRLGHGVELSVRGIQF